MSSNLTPLKLIAVGTNADGRLEVFVMDEDFNLHHTWQEAPNGGWHYRLKPHRSPPEDYWKALKKGGQGQFSSPTVVLNGNNELEVFNISALVLGNRRHPTIGGNLFHINQRNDWSNGWNNLWKPDPPRLYSIPVAVTNALNSVEVFAIGEDGRLWVNVAGANFVDLGDPGVSLQVGEIAPGVGKDLNGLLHVFVIGDDYKLYHKAQIAGGGWGAWNSLNNPGVNIVAPVVQLHSDGRLAVFVTGQDHLYHIYQTAPGGAWSNWDNLGGPGASIANATCAVGKNADDRLEAFVVAGGDLYHKWQQAGLAPWSNWVSLGRPFGNPLVTSPAVGANEDRRLEAFALCKRSNFWGTWYFLEHIRQTAPGGVWSNWDDLARPDEADPSS